MLSYSIKLDDYPLPRKPLKRAAIALIAAIEEHGALGGNSFGAAWLESEHSLKRRDAYALGSLIGDANPKTLSWISGGEVVIVQAVYSRGVFTLWALPSEGSLHSGQANHRSPFGPG